MTFWLTGLSGAGKSTLAAELGRVLAELHVAHHLLDADVLREGLCGDLGHSDADRYENVRRIAETAKLFNQAGLHAIVASISPYRAHRQLARTIVSAECFVEIFIATSLETCIRRDPKGHYARAISGALQSFTGISAPYEVPTAPAITIKTENYSIPQINRILKNLASKFIFGPPSESAA